MRCAFVATVLSVFLFLAACATMPSTSSSDGLTPWDIAYGAVDINASGQIAGGVMKSMYVEALGGTISNRWALRWTAQEGWTDLGSLGTMDLSVTNGISEAGDVVGWGRSETREDHAFLWTNLGGMTDLGTLGGEDSQANAVSDAGHVVGESHTDAEEPHAFLWTAESGMLDLGTLGGEESRAFGVNSKGVVVGESMVATERGYEPSHAFLWNAESGMVDLGTLGGRSSLANAINDRGQVVGWAESEDGTAHAVIWETDGSVTDLGTLVEAAPNAWAEDINENGDVVGWSFHYAAPSDVRPGVIPVLDKIGHAFLWTAESGMIDLGTLGGPTSHAFAINEQGQVVGMSETAAGEEHAFLWTAESGMTDLGAWAGASN